ncbi:MAG: methyltransferase domain-containing protein [Longimicrobiales bacterium]
MTWVLVSGGVLLALLALWETTNRISYGMLKQRILERQKWDLNICCGTTDGGGINADIMRHAEVPRFVLVDVYRAPFRDGQFETVLCSHTIEHVDEPERLFRELQRVGARVTLVDNDGQYAELYTLQSENV